MTPSPTPRQRAKEIIRKFSINDDTYLSYQSKPKEVQIEIEKAITQAILNEREEILNYIDKYIYTLTEEDRVDIRSRKEGGV